MIQKLEKRVSDLIEVKGTLEGVVKEQKRNLEKLEYSILESEALHESTSSKILELEKISAEGTHLSEFNNAIQEY